MAVVAVLGAGAVGARAARQLLEVDPDELLVVDDDPGRAGAVARSLGAPTRAVTWPEALQHRPAAVVLAAPGDHGVWASQVLSAGGHVVSTTSASASVGALLKLDERARDAGRTVVVGAGFAPGLSCLLVRHAAEGFDAVDEIHVARTGVGGPGCAAERNQALWAAPGPDWRDGRWTAPRSAGAELRWFPEPLGGRDCYPAAVGDAQLLAPAFTEATRVTVRVAVSRGERLLHRAPAWRRPVGEGRLGGVRVEVRGRRGALTDTVVLGALDRPALAAGVVAGVTASWVVEGRISAPGAAGLATIVTEPLPLLQDLARRGTRAAVLEPIDAEELS